ncbi:hypothetical protein KFU94_30210 [Chloroflexi bacterium TSY]|nr:hypothetical protein [Chloroflexi bacterium TSY]
MKQKWLLFSVIVVVLMLAACVASPESDTGAADTTAADTSETMEGGSKVVRLGMNQELEFLNVMYTQGGNSLQASKTAQRGLLFLDAEGNWIGELATEVPSVANGMVAPDGSQVTYNLREGITFHDGSSVTAADVKATWEAIMSPDNTPITRLGYDKIESIETPDDLTVIVNFSEPFASWKILFDFVLPAHIIEENSPGLDESRAMRTPIGFGPFKIVQWKPGEFIEYEAFDDYWQGRPNIDKFFIVIYPSTEALLAALEVGEVDIAWGLRAANVPKLQELEANGVDGVEDGTRLSFTHATTSGVLQREQVQLLVQQMLKDVGVEMVIENRRTAELFGTWDQNGVWSHGGYEMGGWSHGLRAPDPEISNRFLCNEIATPDNPGGAQWHRYCNPAVDELLIAAQTEFDEETRNALIFEAQKIMHEDAYAIYLFATGRHYGVNVAIENFELRPFTVWYGNIQEWDLME